MWNIALECKASCVFNYEYYYLYCMANRQWNPNKNAQYEWWLHFNPSFCEIPLPLLCHLSFHLPMTVSLQFYGSLTVNAQYHYMLGDKCIMILCNKVKYCHMYKVQSNEVSWIWHLCLHTVILSSLLVRSWNLQWAKKANTMLLSFWQGIYCHLPYSRVTIIPKYLI
jgi:hypothetical protein